MKRQYCLYSFCFLAVLLIMVSCKKFVQIDAPVNQLVTSSVFNNENTATAAQLAIYAKMYANPVLINRITGLSSDEVYTYATDQTSKNLYANALNAQTDAAGTINIWALGYTYIYYENAILENLSNSNLLSPKVRFQLIGEAAFMRAYWYFYLTNFYGDVPLILSTNYSVNTNMPRTRQSDVYQQVIVDLKAAAGLLNSNYVDATDTAITVDRARPTSWAAMALLARVYLYSGKYDSAENLATQVISSPKYGLSPLSGTNSVFTKNSLEAIWQIIPPTTVGYASEGGTFILNTAPTSSGITSSTQLLNAFEPNDKRKTNWIGAYTKDSISWFYFPYKYKLTTTASPPSGEYSMILRLGEQYLIRAEARALQNKLPMAVADLNVIRTRAGLGLLSMSLTSDQILNAIAHERQTELFTEGHRWFDLKRTHAVDTVMSKVTLQKGGVWNTNQQLYPIPVSDIQNGQNLTQNLGY